MKMADIAALAGVSAAAVSMALRGSERISKETRDRIVALAAQHGYIYNRQAAGLRTQTSKTIAVCLHTITNPVFATTFTAIEHFFWARGWTVMFGDSEDDAKKQNAFVARAIESSVAGVIISPAVGSKAAELEQFAQRLPIVLASREVPGAGLDQVRIEYEVGVAQAMDHLFALGHRQIGWIGRSAGTSTARQGLKAYRTALKRQGIAPLRAWEHACSPDRRAGEVGMLALLETAPELTAVLCFGDLLAVGALKALRDSRKRPGRDFSVVGFDDLEEASYTSPPLTSIGIDRPLMGESAARLLLERIEKRDGPARLVNIGARLVVRETTGRLRA